MRKKASVLCYCGIFLAVAITLGTLWSPAVAAGSWGLSFQTPGQSPVGNATRESLQQLDAAFLGDEQEKVLYLTFDAGYENGYTAGILEVLNKHQVPAAFFLVGSYIDRNPELVKAMADQGHIVGNHTAHHYDMSRISDPATFAQELSLVAEAYEKATGRPMEPFYRPPQGIYSEENLKMAQELGYKTVFWSLAYVDWNNDDQPTEQAALEKLLGRLHNGAVILLHSTSQTNSKILDSFLTACQEQGYRFAPLSELFETTPGQIQSTQPEEPEPGL